MAKGAHQKDDGWSLGCVQVQPGPGESAEVWTLVVQMDEDREGKQSNFMHSPDWNSQDSKPEFQTQSWISSFWLSPKGTLWATDGKQVLCFPKSGKSRSEPSPMGKQTLRIWGLDDDQRFLLGPDGLVLRSKGKNWQDISRTDKRRLVMIDGLDEDSLYAVGHGGSFCHLGTKGWETIDLGVETNLTALHVGADGWIWICGEKGTALRYRAGQIVHLKAKRDRDFRGVVSFQDQIYWAASGLGVEILKDDAIVPFKPDVPGQRIAANSLYLWCCGQNEICRFDGTDWQGEEFT